MTDRDTTTRKAKKRIQVERLDPDQETVPNLTDDEAEAAKGGQLHPGGVNVVGSDQFVR